MNMKFDKDKVLLLHQIMAQATGGGVGVRDEGLLISALESAFHTFDGIELYPTKQEKAARIAFSLITNHALLDGNKRIGMYVMISFLEMNGIYLQLADEEIVRVGRLIARNEMSYSQLHKWILDNQR